MVITKKEKKATAWERYAANTRTLGFPIIINNSDMLKSKKEREVAEDILPGCRFPKSIPCWSGTNNSSSPKLTPKTSWLRVAIPITNKIPFTIWAVAKLICFIINISTTPKSIKESAVLNFIVGRPDTIWVNSSIWSIHPKMAKIDTVMITIAIMKIIF